MSYKLTFLVNRITLWAIIWHRYIVRYIVGPYSQRKIVMTFITVRVEVSCLLRFTPATNSGAHTSQFGSRKVSCLLRFTPATNSGAHTLQFRDCGLILYWSRIRKFVTYRIRKNIENKIQAYKHTNIQRKQLQRPL